MKANKLFFNYCDESAIEALQYLARYDRPSGGQSRFNAEHLYQIARELDMSVKKIKSKIKYFIDCDQDGHDYLIPAEKRKDWEEWNNFDTDNSVPGYAIAIDGVSSIEFNYDPEEN